MSTTGIYITLCMNASGEKKLCWQPRQPSLYTITMDGGPHSSKQYPFTKRYHNQTCGNHNLKS